VKVYSFVGPSGTGKSHRSQWIAREHDIESIIDDGLLIKGNKVLAGCSAKKEPTKIASIRRALFYDVNHTEEVKMAIKKYNLQSILILGTSDGMIQNIVKALDLPDVSKKIRIEDVATEEEIQKALTIRKDEGKHIIPVPTFEIKRQFSGYFLDPLRIFRQRGKKVVTFEADKSVVRPTFSYLGKYIISDYAIYGIVENVALTIDGLQRIVKFRMDNSPLGLRIDVDISVIFGSFIPDVIKDFQLEVKEMLEKLTGMNVIAVNIIAKTLYISPEKEVEL